MRSPLGRPRKRERGSSGFPISRSYRPTAGNPYQATASHLSQFPFASRSQAAPAPLFYSATDEFREDDDEAEHEKEVADLYALQRSRRQFVESHLEESEEGEDQGNQGSGLGQSSDGRDVDERESSFRRGGIKSSWRGGRSSGQRQKAVVGVADQIEENNLERTNSEGSSNGKGKMVDIGLESTMGGSLEAIYKDSPPDDLILDVPPEDRAPSIQHLRNHSRPQDPYSPFTPAEIDDDVLTRRPPPTISDSDSVPPTVPLLSSEPPHHDAFWGNLYLISLAAFFASFLLVYLHTLAPTLKKPLGDTVYTTMHASFHLLAVDTFVAIIVSLLWLTLLRSYVRPLVYLILIAVPVILFAFSLYPFISSFKGPWRGGSLQDKAMRWLSSVPGISAIVWVFFAYKGRHAFEKAVGILEFSSRILASNPALLVVGFGTLVGVVTWTWLWIGMFTRVFLGGHVSNIKNFFMIDLGTWWLAVFFILVYLWTLAVGAGVQRATTAATVSQWYFHRFQVPAPTSQQVVRAAFSHAISTFFGTICFSTLLTLLIRLPLLVLPRRIVALVGLCTYTLLPNSIAVLVHPLTLTYGAIHSQPLGVSARTVAQMPIVAPSNPTISRGRRNTAISRTSAIAPYNLALLLLHSTRLITSLAFGFGAWVSTARTLTLNEESSSTIRGSLYAYIVGLVAGAIGWGILGAMEGVLTGVVDALVVCWASETRNNGEVRYCREAGWLLGGDVREGGEEREGLMRI